MARNKTGRLSQPYSMHPHDHAGEIVKLLHKVELIRNDRPHQIFEDWLDLLLGYFHSLPLVSAYIAKHHEIPPNEYITWIDTLRPEIQESFKRIKNRYGKRFPEAIEAF